MTGLWALLIVACLSGAIILLARLLSQTNRRLRHLEEHVRNMKTEQDRHCAMIRDLSLPPERRDLRIPPPAPTRP